VNNDAAARAHASSLWRVARQVPPTALVALLCVSCAHAERPGLTQQQRGAIEDIVVAGEAGRLNACQAAQIDLDRDGAQETVIVFKVGSHGSQARVLRWQGERPTVLFENGSDTPNTAFCLAEGVPTINLERSQQLPAEAVQLAYQWDGGAFVPRDGVRCATGQDQIAWENCASSVASRE